MYSSTHLSIKWEWSASRHGRFTPEVRGPCTHQTGVWVGPTASLDAETRKNLITVSTGNRTPVVQPVA